MAANSIVIRPKAPGVLSRHACCASRETRIAASQGHRFPERGELVRRQLDFEAHSTELQLLSAITA